MRRVLAAVATAVVAVSVAGCGSDRHTRTAPTTTARSTTARTAPPSAPAVRPVAAPEPVVPHDYVAPAGPTRFLLTGARFSIRANVCAMPPVFPLDPPGEQRHTVCWVTRGFGFMPGSNSRTTFVLGHSWAGDRLEVLNKASWLATRQVLRARPVPRDGVPTFPVTALDGYKLVLWTPRGTLTYRVHDAYGVDKMKLGQIHSTLDQDVKHRIVLITCATLNGVDYPYNIVVTAYLTASSRR